MPTLASYATVANLADYLPGISQTSDGPVLTNFLARASRFIDHQCRDYFGQLTAQTYVFDAAMWPYIYPSYSIVSLTTVSTAPYVGASYTALTSTQWELHPVTPPPNEPYRWLFFPSQGGATSLDNDGRVQLVGTFGWPAVPDDIVHLTCKLAARWWKAKDSGWSGLMGSTEVGLMPVKNLDYEDKQILAYYCMPRLG